MKTIEERATAKYPITAENMDKAIAMRKLYIKIATEQKAIDNAAHTEEMLRKEEEFEMALASQRKECIDKAKEAFNKTCGWLAVYHWYNGVFEEFVKAMEE